MKDLSPSNSQTLTPQVSFWPLNIRTRAHIVNMNLCTNIFLWNSVFLCGTISTSQDDISTLLFHTFHSQQNSPEHSRLRNSNIMVLLWLERSRARRKFTGCLERPRVHTWPQETKLTNRPHSQSTPK